MTEPLYVMVKKEKVRVIDDMSAQYYVEFADGTCDFVFKKATKPVKN
jgi:hypothetical protein